MTRCPLNPCDKFILMLDEVMRVGGLSGNACNILIRLDDVPSVEELRTFGQELLQKHPYLAGRLAFRGLFRQAFWEWNGDGEIGVEDHPDLESVINSSIEPVFRFCRIPDGVVVRYHHALMDAKGGEELLKGGTSPVEKGRELDPELARHGWWRRLNMAFRMRKQLQGIDGKRPALFEHTPRDGKKTFGVRLDTLDESQTGSIMDRAQKACGLLQRNLHFLSATFRALDEFAEDTGPLVIALPANLRKREWAPVVTNYLTFFHFVVPREMASDQAALARYLKGEHLRQLKEKDDLAMVYLLNLGRRMSLARYMKERVSQKGRERLTAYFSYPGDATMKEFLGRPIREYRPFPSVPPNPGLGLFIAEFGGKLLLSTVYCRETVDRNRAEAFAEKVRECL